MRKAISIAAATLLFAPLLLAEGEVYRWKDANGVWHYSDQPQPGAELVKTGRRNSSSSMPSAPPPPPAAVNNAASAPLPVSPQVAQQVRQEAASAKDEQCKKATAAYQEAVQARRIYKTDEKGNRTYLDSAQIDNARLEARAARDLACGA
jgi:hypothetical protein